MLVGVVLGVGTVVEVVEHVGVVIELEVDVVAQFISAIVFCIHERRTATRAVDHTLAVEEHGRAAERADLAVFEGVKRHNPMVTQGCDTVA